MNNSDNIVNKFHIKGKGFRVVEIVDQYYHFEFEGELSDLIERIKKNLEMVKTLYKSYGFDPATFDDMCKVYYYDNSYYDEVSVQLRWERPERKHERAARLAENKKKRERKKAEAAALEELERTQYEKLKKKFEAENG